MSRAIPLRLHVFAVMSSLGVAAGVAAQAPPTEVAPGDPDTELIRRLNETIVEADYDRIDFSKIIDDLRERYQLNIHVNWSSVSSAGVERDARVEVKLSKVPLSTLMDFILVAVGGPKADLGYEVHRGVILISTRDDLSRKTVVRAYDLTDLMRSGYSMRRFANTPILRLRLAGGEATGGQPVIDAAAVAVQPGGIGGGGGGGVFGGGAGAFPVEAEYEEAAAVAATFEDIAEAIDLMQSLVEPESWREAGGAVGSIRSSGNLIIVTQTLDAHRQIESLLSFIRRAAPSALDADAWIVRIPRNNAADWRTAIGESFPRIPADRVPAALRREAGIKVMFHGTSSGFNGRRIWFSNLSQRFVLGSYLPVLGDGVWSVQPVVESVNEGLELIALPLVAPDSQSLTLDVQMAWAPSAEIRQLPVTLGPQIAIVRGFGEPSAGAQTPISPVGTIAATGAIELATRRMRTVSTTARLRFGDAIALSISDNVNGPMSDDEDWIVLHVRAAR